ncbi:hypothetical protein P152DRAFT_448488 [Eremomyces bilateralis CBS 781.70]|uniref:Zf-MIZ-domain-containing protein n=1 Tax=Eremomyces bilateralis CBS 781.70 TaxID=1392243 RepID=A0A6G1G548_9PEZI|nr:uncharacterized protein P152DRAFT_448488 [Eremomyces bilateralis CBS 781.70]KAF1813148.1 hypothetical protein P152DRAFT_448488 [Eremomyces bilateralis CBS 781.70]
MRNQLPPPASSAEVEQLYNRMGTLTNNELKAICRAEKELVSGTKPILQARVTKALQTAINRHDTAMFERIRYRLLHRGQSPPYTVDFGNGDTLNQSNGSTAFPSRPHQTSTSTGRPIAYPSTDNGAMSFRQMLYSFKPSPFFDIIEQIGVPIELPTLPEYKRTVSSTLVLTSQTLDKMKTNEDQYRIMLFGAANPDVFMATDVAFPSSFEVRINHDEVKGNFKGIKGKPGTTKPADITRFVRKMPAYRNTIDVTYATTHKVSGQIRPNLTAADLTKKFVLFPYLVKAYSATDLASIIKARAIISKQQTLKEMNAKAKDPDINFTSSVMSLKDPISTLRIQTPCRSTVCSHFRCFDITSFLQLQEQAPTWSCPICSKNIKFDDLAVDQYVQEILKDTPKSLDQVTIEPNGEWSSRSADAQNHSQQESPGLRKLNGYDDGYSDNDSDIEVVPSRAISNLKSETTSTPMSVFRTPPFSPRSGSATTPNAPAIRGTSRANGTTSSASKRRDVVDLTLSSDEEGERPRKRRQTDAVGSNSGPTNFLSNPLFLSSSNSKSSRQTLPSNFSFSIPRPTTPPGGAAANSSFSPSSAAFNFNAGPRPAYGSSTSQTNPSAYRPAPHASGSGRSNGYGGSGTSDALGNSMSPDRGRYGHTIPRRPSIEEQQEFIRSLGGLDSLR